MRPKYTILLIVLVLLISGCANRINMGVRAYKHGDYDKAARYWLKEAKKGNPRAQYGMGILLEQGLGSFSRNDKAAAKFFALSAKQGFIPAMVELGKILNNYGYTEKAVSWLNLAARWGNKGAIYELRNMNQPVPEPDLLKKKKLQDEIERQKTIRTLGLIALGTVNGANQALLASSGGTSGAEYQNRNCYSDYDCNLGSKCVKPPLQSEGTCMKSVNSLGVPTYSMPDSNSIGPNMDLDGQCSFDLDCPIGFKCNSHLKVCVRY